jgi:hypothetical protein
VRGDNTLKIPETIIIIETSAKIQLVLGQEFMVAGTRTYGATKIWFV